MNKQIKNTLQHKNNKHSLLWFFVFKKNRGQLNTMHMMYTTLNALCKTL